LYQGILTEGKLTTVDLLELTCLDGVLLIILFTFTK